MTSETPQQMLTRAGLRPTRQRVAIVEELGREHSDVTAQDLHGRLLAAEPRIGLATVYRTLNGLADEGVIDRLQHGSHQCFRLCSPGHHHHLTCTSCHAVVELLDCAIDPWVGEQAARHGYTAVTHQIELRGLCASCRATGGDSTAARGHAH